MARIWHREMDPVFETGSLLNCGLNKIYAQKRFLEEMTQLGAEGTVLYTKYNKLFAQYIDWFEERRVYTGQEDFFFTKGEFEFSNIMLLPFLLEKKLCSLVEQLSEEQLHRLLFAAIKNQTKSDENMANGLHSPKEAIEWLEQVELREQTKWKLLLVLKEPGRYFAYLAKMLQANIPIAKQVLSSVERQFKFDMPPRAMKMDEFYGDFHQEKTEIYEVYPSLVYPFAKICIGNTCYYGIIWNELMLKREKEEDLQKMLTARLRVLSDHNKLEILRLLIDHPCYNLEIANHMGLTAATVSYHMDALLSCGMVTMEKKSKRIYYTFVRESIAWVRRELDSMFFPEELEKSPDVIYDNL